MNSKLKDYLPYIIALLFFLGLAIAYIAPSVFENKELMQDDVINSAAWGKDLKDYHKATGDYAFWSNSMFSGMPANYTFMPPIFNIFSILHQAIISLLPGNIAVIFLFLIGFYIFMLSIGCKSWLSIVGAIAYAFATFNIVSMGAGHINKCLVMSTMAPIIGGIILCYRGKYLWGTIITLVFSGLNILWAHQQVSYYLLIIILILAVVYFIYAIKEHTLKDYFKSSAILIVVGILAVAPDLGRLISTADYAKETMRGGAVLQADPEGKKESGGLEIDYAFLWSYGKAETMTFLIPNFYGASTYYDVGSDSEFYKVLLQNGYSPQQAAQNSKYASTYWGDQPGTAGPVYMGAIICFLFVLGLIIVKGPEKWWLLGATIVSIILSWGSNAGINEFLFYHLPLYNKFRTPSMALAMAEITMVTLAILAVKEIFDNRENRDKYLKPLYISFGIVGGICLIYALIGGSLMSFSGPLDERLKDFPALVDALISDRQQMLTSDAWRSFFFIILAAGALWYYIKKPFKLAYVVAILGVLILVDLWTVDKRFLNYDSFVPKKRAREFVATEADKQIIQDRDPNYRVFNLTASPFQESHTPYFHKSIGGYSPAKLRRYQDIIDYHFSRGINMDVVNMLNTRYFITSTQQGVQQVQRNFEALGNAWFVNEIQWVNSPDEEIVALKDFDPAKKAFIDVEWKDNLPNWERLQQSEDSTAMIQLVDYANPGYLIYESQSAQPHLAVFSEVYYKTWHAYIDGQEVPLVRVNYILRGLEVPAGNHTIEFKCIDDIYQRGVKLSMIGSIIAGIVLLTLFGYAIWYTIRKNKATENQTV